MCMCMVWMDLLALTKGKGYEVFCFPEASIFIQKVAWVKLLWVGELLAVIQD